MVVDRGATLLLYTDGRVERRGESLEVGLHRLSQTLGEFYTPGRGGRAGEPGAGLDLDSVVDELLDRLVPDQGEDDVAVLAVQLHRQDRPRPVEAGPQVIGDVVPAED